MWIPRLLTIIFIVLVLLIALLLMLAAWRHRSPPVSDLGVMPEDIREFGPAATNRWLVALRYILLLLLAAVFGFGMVAYFGTGGPMGSANPRAIPPAHAPPGFTTSVSGSMTGLR